MTRSGRSRFSLLIALLALGAFVVPQIEAAPTPKEKKSGSKKSRKTNPPSPAKQLAKAYKNLVKAGNYKTTLRVEGGLSNTPDHKLFQAAVRTSYDGEVFRSLLSVPAENTFKTPKKGVRYYEGYWRNVVSDRQGKMLNSFFRFPEDVLRQALRHAKKGKWIDGAAAEAEEDGEKSKKSSKKSKKKESSKSKKGEPGGTGTIVVDDDDDDESAAESEESSGMPRVLLIEAPTKEALTHYLTVENSGCLGGG